MLVLIKENTRRLKMEIAVVGINHNKAPIEVRERFSFTESMKIESGDLLLDKSIKETVIISTCNRSEIYIAASCKEIEKAVLEVKTFYREYFKFKNADKYLFEKTGKDAVVHLYVVASGLDSMVLGEDQILGQIREAMMSSMDLGFSKKVLNRLFMDAISEGKKIRSELKISEIPLSTSYIGISLLRKNMGSLKGKKALIVGAGKMSSLAIKYLYEEELDEIYVTNRTHGRMKDVFERFGEITPVEYADRYKIIKDVDLIITATGAPHIILKDDDILDTKEELYILDLALPRDVDWKLGKRDNITLYHNDDLKKLSEENLLRRKELSERAVEIINGDVEKYLKWIESIKVDPMIKSLNQRCTQIKEDTMDYINRKVDLNKRDEKIVDKMVMSALKQFIREPIKLLKQVDEDDSEEYIDAIKKIFEI